MTPTDVVKLVNLVAAACPSMRMEPNTPDAWYLLLEDLPAEDCIAAVVALAKVRPYIAVSDIREKVRAIRTERIALEGHRVDPPDVDPQAWPAAMRAHLGALAAGKNIARALTGPPTAAGCPAELRDLAAKPRVGALAVTCPWCGAIPGEQCHTPQTRRKLRQAGVHPMRITAAAAGDERTA